MKRVIISTAMVLFACVAHAADYVGSDGGQEWNGAIGKTFLVLFGIGLIAFCLAYPKVKRGELVVYASWADFGMSLLWTPLAGLGIVKASGLCGAQDGVGMAIEIVLAILGIVSVLWLIWGAFKHNRGAYACLVSLGARMFVALLFILAMSKLADGKKSLKENGENAAAVKAALVAFAIFGFIFTKLIKPMIGTRMAR